MDEKKVREAIERVKNFPGWNRDDLWLGMEDMEELTETILEALEKQLPKKVENRTEYIDLNGKLIFFKAFCPSCGRVVESYRNLSCHVCTQRLDWSEDRKVKE